MFLGKCYLDKTDPDYPGMCGWGIINQGSSECEECECGNEEIEGVEECDEGSKNSDIIADACRTDCKNPSCGDNVIDGGEECDDGNTENKDGCDENCLEEVRFISIDLSLDEDFIEKAKERDLILEPDAILNPFYDGECEVILKGSDVPTSLNGKLRIPGTDTIIASGEFVIVEKEGDNPDYTYYRWVIKGWWDGWTASEEDMNELIDEEKIECVVEINDEEEKVEKEILTCVHISGKDKNKFNVLNLRDETVDKVKMPHTKLVDSSRRIVEFGFQAIEPFKKYNTKFSHYVELKPKACAKIIVPNILTKFHDFGNEDKDGDAVFGSKVQQVSYKSNRIWTTTIHELGHSLCILDDEYVYSEQGKPVKSPYGEKNCKKEDFWPSKFGGKFAGCTHTDWFRPTEQSIMNTAKGYTNEGFNIVSCGYCIEEIEGGKKKIDDYWEECKGLTSSVKINLVEEQEVFEDGCYIELEINEKKIGNEIEFNLLRQENVYGVYDGSVKQYRDNDYAVNVYGGSETVLSKQGLESGRFVFYDSFESGTSGYDELDEANIKVIIPYFENIRRITITNNGFKTPLNIDASAIKCDCGNGICSEREDKNSCPKDCIRPKDVNDDKRINILDMIFIRNRLNSDFDIGNNQIADVNQDSKVNILDLILVRNFFGS